MIAVSEKTLAVCAAFYIECGKRNGCGRCPIHAECTAPLTWSDDGFDKHRAALNSAAEKVDLGKDLA